MCSKRPELANLSGSGWWLEQRWCKGKIVFDKWTAENAIARGHTHQILERSLCGYHSDESWSRLSHIELMDRRGWEQEAVDPTAPKNTAHHINTDTTHIHRHTKPQGEKKSRNKRWASNQRALQKLNQHRLSDEEEHFWFLWAGAFINHPQKKHHSTATWVEDPLFRHRLCRAKLQKIGRRMKGRKKAIHALSNQSNQLWSASMSRGLMFQMNTRHLHVVVWFVLCTFPCHISKERTFHYNVVSYRHITLDPQAVLFLAINL